MEPVVSEGHVHTERGEWTRWPVYWSAIWVGTLTALVIALLVGLAAIALGAHEMGPGRGIVKWSEFGMGALFFSVVGSFAYNATMTLGGAAVAHPLQLRNVSSLHVPLIMMIGALVLVLALALPRRRLSRLSGVVLLCAYPLFVVTTILVD